MPQIELRLAVTVDHDLPDEPGILDDVSDGVVAALEAETVVRSANGTAVVDFVGVIDRWWS